MRAVRLALLLLALLICAGSVSAQTPYRGYLATRDDDYHCEALRPWVDRLKVASLSHIVPEALTACLRIQELDVAGRRLTDEHNPAVVAQGRQARIEIWNPTTLFAPFAMTFDPDVSNSNRVGWPLRDAVVQARGFNAVNARKPGCIKYVVADTHRQSPYTSHCSAYAAWVAHEVFGVNLMPTRVGDWCHVAAEQRNRMRNDPAHWQALAAEDAQRAANSGGLVLAARQTGAAATEPGQFNGHIAIVLPQVVAGAQALQQGANYPLSPPVQDRDSFIEFLEIHGPEIAQAGALNFAHTVASNGFSQHYSAGAVPGVAPIDNQVEFYLYMAPTKIRSF